MRPPVTRWRGRRVPAHWTQQLAGPGYDYVDLHRLDLIGADRFAAETWARAMFEYDEPALARLRHRGLLGVSLSRPRGPDGIGSWDLVERSQQLVRLRGSGPGTTDEVLVVVEPDAVVLLTAVTFVGEAPGTGPRRRRKVVGLAWKVLSVLHRRFAPLVLRHAARALAPGADAGLARGG